MFRITKQFRFEASHSLENLPPGHKCSRLHGHNYVVEIELSSEELDPSGFVVDYGEVSKKFRLLLEEWDHEHLNDVCDFNPTAENMAHYLYVLARAWWPEVTAMRVSETPDTWAEFREA